VVMTYNKFVKLLRIFIISCLVITISGIFSFFVVKNNIKKYNENLIHTAKLSTLLFKNSEIESLDGNRTDLNKLEYKKIKNRLDEISNIVFDSEFVYLTRLQDKKIIFLADNVVDVDDSNISLPGDIYYDYTDDFYQIFFNGKYIIEGPVKDRWGNWLSALVPIRNNNREIIAVLGIDIDSKKYYNIIFVGSLPAILIFTISLLLICAVFFIADPIRN
jgi:sensor histidine kinase regulating citrate/malate metabolism